MRVLYLLSSNVMGGASISFLNLILSFDKRDITPVVVFPNKVTDSEFENVLKLNGIEFHHSNLVESVMQKPCMNNIVRWVAKYLYLSIKKRKSRKELSSIINRVNPDIIHTNVGTIHEGFHLAKKRKIPHVWHLREYQTLDFQWYIYPSFNKFCSYLRQSFVITITDDIKRHFRLEKQGNAFTIYNGIFRANEISNITQKENYFLMASRISREKGHADVITAFSHFSKRNDYKLKIIGFGDEKYIAELEALAKYNRCEDRIEFLGYKNDVKPLMTKAKALIVASYNEGFGRMTAESAFCGTIVIGKNTGGTKEILDRTGGLLFDTVQELEDQMEHISKMEEGEYNNIARKAQIIASRSYSVENNVFSIKNLYKQMLTN